MSNKTIARVSCACKGQSAEFQDQRYGKNVRVANLQTKSDKPGVSTVDVTCTCCGHKHSVNKTQLI